MIYPCIFVKSKRDVQYLLEYDKLEADKSSEAFWRPYWIAHQTTYGRVKESQSRILTIRNRKQTLQHFDESLDILQY